MRFFLIGLCILILRFHLPHQVEVTSQLMTGTIGSIAEHHGNTLEFIFIPDNTPQTNNTNHRIVGANPRVHPFTGVRRTPLQLLLFLQQRDNTQQKIWVNWYHAPPVNLHIGDRWELALQINPTTQHWLLAQNVNGVASVQMNYKNQLLERHHWSNLINHIREKLYLNIQKTLLNNSSLGFISALSVGMRDEITESQWSDLRATGTNHLMAIAGLHIGFVASFAYAIINLLWRRFARLMLLMPAQEAASIAALGAGILYSALAGFSLPTQRAIIMLSVFLLSKIRRRNIGLLTSYFIALGMILAYEPLAILTASFWLSFSAVGLLIYGNSARLNENKWWWHYIHAQWVMTVGLISFGLLFFQQMSLVSLIANFIAIPFIGFIILPLCLLGDISTFGLFWKLAAFLLNHFWIFIHWLAKLPNSQIEISINSHWIFISTLIATLLFLAPRGFPGRWLGWIWLLPLIEK